jgi:hypothetical protein
MPPRCSVFRARVDDFMNSEMPATSLRRIQFLSLN